VQEYLVGGIFLSEEEMFSEEGINKRSRVIALTGYLGAIAFLKEKNIPIKEFGKFIGKKAAPSWESVKGAPARTIAMYFAWNMASYGADNFKYDGDEKEAIVEIENWPSDEVIKGWDVTLEDLDDIMEMNQPIIDYLGMSQEYKRDGKKITIKLKK